MRVTKAIVVICFITLFSCDPEEDNLTGEPIRCSSSPHINIHDKFNTVGVASFKKGTVDYRSLQDDCIDTMCTGVRFELLVDSTYELSYQVANELERELYSASKGGNYSLRWCYRYYGGLGPGQWTGTIILNPGEPEESRIPFTRNLPDHPLAIWIPTAEGELYLWIYEKK